MSRELRRGFTFIEILVVIIIVVILALLLVPVISRQKESVHKSNCISNLKELGEAWRMYAAHYDDKMCPHFIPENGWVFRVVNGIEFYMPAPTGDRIYWSYGTTTRSVEEGLLFPYLKDVSIVECETARWIGGPVRNINPSYGLNIHLDKPTFGDPYRGVGVSEVEIPSETLVMADTAAYSIGVNGSFNLCLSATFSIMGDGSKAQGRHDGSAHALWVDGHVSSEVPDTPTVDVEIQTEPPRELMSKDHLGDILKVSRESANAMYFPPFDSTDFYYYYTTKPPMD